MASFSRRLFIPSVVLCAVELCAGVQLFESAGLRKKMQICTDSGSDGPAVGGSSNRLELLSGVADGPKIEPTYKYMGCYKIENDDKERLKPETVIASNTEAKCYNFCHGEEKKEEQHSAKAKFFLLKGGECSCLNYINKNPSPGATCTDPCPGAKNEKCGGPGVESVFVMVDCPVLPKSKVAIVKEKHQKAALEKQGLAY